MSDNRRAGKQDGLGIENPADLDVLNKVVDTLARRGMVPILHALAARSLGHNELARATGMDSKQLSRALCHARDMGLVERIVTTHDTPVRVRYELTSRGDGLVGAMTPLTLWSRDES